ncbi:hypothetical protein AG1IA_04268 [Rhizoctonia solani AG-1 IA]|uniref:Uncharacterized protein n=1 Tax=Thanatephorus cucumeris (strain AG1-IA) TaxID=983506 RepID=L8WU83_THACA|nr:hypothetical protein AG1IA_04268 [Rhizoctonia solani AG-1 IA]
MYYHIAFLGFPFLLFDLFPFPAPTHMSLYHYARSLTFVHTWTLLRSSSRLLCYWTKTHHECCSCRLLFGLVTLSRFILTFYRHFLSISLSLSTDQILALVQ